MPQVSFREFSVHTNGSSYLAQKKKKVFVVETPE